MRGRRVAGAGPLTDAFDLDPQMVALARRRLAGWGSAVRVSQGDACAIDAEDGRYDAVFDFGIIHHVPQWRRALSEIYRVLRPGGRFYAEEVFEKFLAFRITRRLLVHPESDRFDCARFRLALEETGFAVGGARDVWGLGGFFFARRPEGVATSPR